MAISKTARLTSRSSPPSSRRRAFTAVFLALTAVVGALMFVYTRDDAPLPPAPAGAGAVIDWRTETATNGWAFLREKVLAADRPNFRYFQDMVGGRKPWDVPGAAAMSGNGSYLQWVEEALAMPEFLIRTVSGEERNGDYRMLELTNSLRADLMLSMLRNDRARAMRAARASAALAALHFRQVADHSGFDAALLFQREAVGEALILLASGPCDRETIHSLTDLVEADPYGGDTLHRVLVYLTRDEGPWGIFEFCHENGPHIFGHRFYQPNRTRRILAREEALMPRGAPETAPDLDSSVGGRLQRRYPKLWGMESIAPSFHPNALGVTCILPTWARMVDDIDGRDGRSALFTARAMRVTRAAMLWRLDHGGEPPAALAELVPEYLEKIPADPWNGAPLAWDPALEIVSAVGTDWVASPPDPAQKPGTLRGPSTGVAELRLPAYLPPP